MSLPAPIAADHKALARIVAGLFAMLGLSGGQSNNTAPQWIARSLYRAVGLVLRPAESAVRRLIFFLSFSIRTKPATVRPMPSGFVPTRSANARRAFRLFDPRLQLVRKMKSTTKAARAQPRISFFGDGEIRTVDLRAPKDAQADDEIASASLLRRLGALKSALDDLPLQARRLVRALQRRQKSPCLKMQGPLRPDFRQAIARGARMKSTISSDGATGARARPCRIRPDFRPSNSFGHS